MYKEERMDYTPKPRSKKDELLQGIQSVQNVLHNNTKRFQQAFEIATGDTTKRDGKFPLQSTADAYTIEERQMAMLIRLSSEVQKAQLSTPDASMSTLLNEAQVTQTLDDMRTIELGDFTLMPEFATNQELVFKNNATGKVWVAARGTEGKYTMRTGNLAGFNEPRAWGQILTGTEGGAEPHVSIRDTVDRVIASGVEPADMVLGGSSMGARVYRVADTRGIPSIMFGPASGPNDIYGATMNPEIEHRVVSTTTDLPSIYMRSSEGRPSNISIKTVDPRNTFRGGRVKMTGIFDAPIRPYSFAMDHHVIQQVSSEDEMRIAALREKSKLSFDGLSESERLQSNGAKLGEIMQRLDMRQAIRNGESYSEYMMRGTNTGDYELAADGRPRLKGNRMSEGSLWNDLWKQEVDAMGGIPQSSDSTKFANRYFTAEEIEHFKKNPLLDEMPEPKARLSDSELTSLRNGQLTEDGFMQQMADDPNISLDEQNATLSRINTDYDAGQLKIDPMKLASLKRFVGGGSVAAKFAAVAGLNYSFKKTGMSKLDADALTGSTIAVAARVPSILGKAAAVEGVAKKAGTLFREAAKVASTDAPGEAVGFIAADEAYEGADKLFADLKVKPSHRLVIESGIAASTGAVASKLTSTAIRKAASKVGEKVLGKVAVKATEEAGVKLLTDVMKASEVGAVLGEAIDIGVNTYSLVDAWSKHQQVTTDQIGDSVNNVLNPFAFVDDIGGIKTGSSTADTAISTTARAVDFIPYVNQFRMMGKAGREVSGVISHAAGAKTNVELNSDYQAIAHKFLQDLGDQTMSPTNYVDATSELKSKLSADDLSVINTVNPKFFDEASRQYHTVWQTYAINMRKQRIAETEHTTSLNNAVEHALTATGLGSDELYNGSTIRGYFTAYDNGSITQSDLQHVLTAARVEHLEEQQFDRLQSTSAADFKRVSDASADVRAKGFYDLDQTVLTDPTSAKAWNPSDSQILLAHRLGMTLKQYQEYSTAVGHGGKLSDLKTYTPAELRAQGITDDLHLVDELSMYYGADAARSMYTYDPKSRKFTLNPNHNQFMTSNTYQSVYTPETVLRAQAADRRRQLTTQIEEAAAAYNSSPEVQAYNDYIMSHDVPYDTPLAQFDVRKAFEENKGRLGLSVTQTEELQNAKRRQIVPTKGKTDLQIVNEYQKYKKGFTNKNNQGNLVLLEGVPNTAAKQAASAIKTPIKKTNQAASTTVRTTAIKTAPAPAP